MIRAIRVPLLVLVALAGLWWWLKWYENAVREAHVQHTREVRRVEYAKSIKGLSFWRHIYIDKVKYDCFTVPDSDSLKCYASPEDQGI